MSSSLARAREAGVARRAPADGARDPRHPRPRASSGIITQLEAADQTRGTAGAAPAPRRSRSSSPGRASPRRAAPCRRCAPTQLEEVRLARRARGRSRARWCGPDRRRPRRRTTTGSTGSGAPGVEVALLRTGAGGARERRQARRRASAVAADALLHGRRRHASTCATTASGSTLRRRDAGGARRRLRPDRRCASASSSSAATLAIESEPGVAAPRSAVERAGRGRDERPIRLLIVDDHPVVRDGLTGHLRQRATATSRCVGRGGQRRRQAVELARALKPDVILMDLRMPGMDGRLARFAQLARRQSRARARAHDVRQRTPTCCRRSRRARPATCSRTRRVRSCCAPSARRPRGESVLSPAVATRAPRPGARARWRRAGSSEPASSRS